MILLIPPVLDTLILKQKKSCWNFSTQSQSLNQRRSTSRSNLFDEHGNRNWIKFYDSEDDSDDDDDSPDPTVCDNASIDSEEPSVPDLIDLIDSDSDEDTDDDTVEMCNVAGEEEHHRWCHACPMPGHSKMKCSKDNLCNDSEDDEDGVYDCNTATDEDQESESEPEPEEAYRTAMSSIPIEPRKMRDPNLFIADTGATCHIKVDTKGMTNLRKVNKTVRMGQSSVKILFQGNYECEAHQVDGTVHKVVLKDVRVC